MLQQTPIQTLVPGGAPIELAAYYDQFTWYYLNCEMETKYWFVQNVQPDWVMFDVGANIGYYSILFSRLAPQGHIHAFEPTKTARMLQTNLNHSGCANVTIHEMALGAQTGEVVDSIYRIWGDEAEERVYPFMRLDDFVARNGIERLDCIKIDVDSFDFEVLQGATETIRALKPKIVVELNDALARRNQSNVKVFEWLRDLGVQEIISLDGANFVVTPGGDPRDTFPVKSAISLAFADTAAMPAPLEAAHAFETWQTIYPGLPVFLHGSAQMEFHQDGSLALISNAQQWSNLAHFVLDTAFEPDPDLHVEVDIEVQTGRLAIGCVGEDGTYIGPERQIGADGRKRVRLPMVSPAEIKSVMLRNIAPGDIASTARLLSVRVGRVMRSGGV
jgi:FkbM family methyltransferase